MGSFRHISDLTGFADMFQLTLGGGELVNTLTSVAELLIFSYSPKHKALVAWTNNVEQLLGTKDVDIARDGNIFLRHVHQDDRFTLLSELEQSLKGTKLYRNTYRWIRPDTNEVRWLHCRGQLSNQEGPEGERLFEGVIIDLSKEFVGTVGKLLGPDSIGTILSAFPTMVLIFDTDLRLVRVNRLESESSRFTFSFGDPHFRADQFKVGRPILDCFSDQAQRSHFEHIMGDLLAGRIPRNNTRIFEKGDPGSDREQVFSLEMVPLIEDGAVHGLLCVVSDISQTIKIERQLADLQKAEGLRLLAAGVAHHFNNSLQSIIGHASVVNAHPENVEMVKQASEAIIDIVNKTSELSKQLFVFEDRQQSTLLPVDLNLSVMAAINRIEDVLSSGFKVAVAFGNLSQIRARQAELCDAIEAILRNAKEAMSATDGDTRLLSIKTYEVSLREYEIGDLKAGTYAKVSISDSGCGMDPETVRRCFEPFFTTKNVDPRSGISITPSGLGLSKAFTIVREFDGGLAIESSPGVGTTISIYFPLLSSSKEALTQSLFSVDRTKPPQILVIDDDIMVLKTMSVVLKDFGYSCIVADDYTRALTLTRTFGNSLELVLLDALMPGMDGPTLLRKLKRLRPELKVVGFSGAPAQATAALMDAGALQVLHKPVPPKMLKEVVERVLHAQKAA